MFGFSVQNFRGFHEPLYVPIRPITILIGENSAGKSSFLAALKFVMDFVSGIREPSFNNDPFQLGTFQQISHYRGGKAGRAKSFDLRLRGTASQRHRKGAEPTSMEIEFRLHFVSSDSQAAVGSVAVAGNGEVIRARIENERLHLDFVSRSGETYSLGEPTRLPRLARSDFFRYWPYVLRDLGFRIGLRTSDDAPTLPPEIEQSAARLADCAEDLSRRLSIFTEATSAIRTKPQRTYTPGIETRDGEGSHVPFEMAKLYRSKTKDGRDEWKKIKDAIENFGSSSEMFKDLSIKSFGTTVSDPFQIQFSSDGPKTNIADLGYGTSQVLPLLYSVISSQHGSMHLIQQPEVHLHPKAQASLGSFFVDAFLGDAKNFVLETHSDFIVDRVRNSIRQKLIRPEHVSILFFERKRLENTITEIDLDETGSPIDPPASYRSFFMDEQLRLLGVE